MTYNDTRRGFTLIELLVVVLIIGILAAVALPQYQIAVAKTRMTQLLTLANAVKQAEEIYFLANGKYSTDWSELDISLEGTVNGRKLINPAGWTVTLVEYLEGSSSDSMNVADSRLPVHIILSYDNARGIRGQRSCYTSRTSELGNQICKSATQKTEPDKYPTGEYRYDF